MGDSMGATTFSSAILPCTTLVLLASLLAGCLGEQGSPQRLSDVEVRDYHEQRFSSVNDFRENSTRGPQGVNITDYRLTIDGLVRVQKSLPFGPTPSSSPLPTGTAPRSPWNTSPERTSSLPTG